ncbi:MAG: thioredoxin family protein [Akkermansia sp.]|nr:thioredoxin family protein [Akkermansia sp.]
MMRHLAFLSSAAIIAPAVAAATWNTDLDTALAQAAAENKPIVLDFTGSDWCGWCITMRREVLDTQAFLDYARNNFVLMEVDIPRNSSKLTKKQLRQNNELQNRYKVTKFPSVLVITAQGELLGGFEGGRLELAAIQGPLNQALANHRLLQQAKNRTGIEKARLLMEIYRNIPFSFHSRLSTLRQEIATLDAENATGIVTEQKDIETVQRISEQTRNMSDSDAIPLLTAALPTVNEPHKLTLRQLLTERINNRIRHTQETADCLSDIELMKADNLLLIEYCVPSENKRYAIERLNADFNNPQQILMDLRRERQERSKYQKQKSGL